MEGNRRVFELADTTTTSSQQNAAITDAKILMPAIWLNRIVEAAKKRHFATQFAHQTMLRKGEASVVVPLRRVFIGSGVANTWAGSAAQGAAVSFLTFDTLCGVSLFPTDQNYGIAIANRAVRTHAVDIVRAAREELVYTAGDAVDREVFTKLTLNDNAATSTARGSQSILGGDATQASELADGDILTTDLIAGAKRRLQSSLVQARTLGTGEALSSQRKNPWINESGSPFVLFIAPEQEEVLLTDSQFINASEYGSDKIIHNGEIGEYLGIKVIVSDNVVNYDGSVTHADGTTTAAGVESHRCMLIKAQKAVALAVGLQPRLVVFDFPSELEKRLIIEQAYAAKQLHSDAIVHIDVTDN